MIRSIAGFIVSVTIKPPFYPATGPFTARIASNAVPVLRPSTAPKPGAPAGAPQVRGSKRVHLQFSDKELSMVDWDYQSVYWPGGYDLAAALPVTVGSGETAVNIVPDRRTASSRSRTGAGSGGIIADGFQVTGKPSRNRRAPTLNPWFRAARRGPVATPRGWRRTAPRAGTAWLRSRPSRRPGNGRGPPASHGPSRR